MQHAQDHHGVAVLDIDHDIIGPDNHFARAGDATRPIELRMFPQLRYFVLDFIFQPLGGIGIVVGYVIDDSQHVGPRRLASFKPESGHGASCRSAPGPHP